MVYITIVDLAKDKEALKSNISDYVKFRFEGIMARREYISVIASNFNKDLQNAVEKTVRHLRQQIKMLRLMPADKIVNIRSVGKRREALNQCVNKIIGEAVEIKTSYLS